MSTTATEKCFSNIDIIENICKFLNRKDEFQLINTTQELQYIITNYIWKTKYKEVEVINNGNDFLVSNKIDILIDIYNESPTFEPSRIKQINNVILDKSEMQKFFNFNKQNINKLQIKNIYGNWKEHFKFPLKLAFENLIYLSLVDVTLEDEDLCYVADNCKTLESLVLQCLDPKGSFLYLNDYIRIDSFKSMRNLKILNMKGISCNYTYLKDLINNLNLVEFSFNCENKSSREANKNLDSDSDVNVEKLKALKVLEIEIFHNEDDYLHFQQHFLPNFENLCRLKLRKARITVNFFYIILKFCKQLTHLEFVECEFEIFKPLPILQELTLDVCNGLSWYNLKTILSEMNLKCFSSFVSTFIIDDIVPHNFYITPKLQEIRFLPEWEEEYNVLIHNHRNLNELREIHLTLYKDLTHFIELQKIAPNLKILNLTVNKEVDKFIYMGLKNLQKIVIKSTRFMDAKEFLRLLMLENLQELSIFHISHYEPVQRIEDMKVFKPLSAVQINLRYLHICWPQNEYILNFICNLLRKNRKLTLICREIDPMNIIDIVSRTTFLKHCKFINICGFDIDRLSIEKYRSKAMKQLTFVISTFEKLKLETYFILQ